MNEGTDRDQANQDGREKRPRLPDWCDVYKGLSEQELAEVDEAVRRRADLTRAFRGIGQ